MKTLFLTLVATILICSAQGQQLTPSVLAVGGDSFRGAGLWLDWTLGEVAVKTLPLAPGQVTEGMHQPSLQILPIDPGSGLAEGEIQVKLAPNPVQSHLRITLSSDREGSAFIDLHDAHGRLLRQETGNLQQDARDWDMSSYPAGMYMLSFRTRSGELLKTFKVEKMR